MFHLCRRCDRGQMYCPDGRHDAERRRQRKESQRRYWLSRDGRLATAERTRRWRERERQKETDMGRRKVGPAPIVASAERSAVTVTVEPLRQETTHEINLDGHCARLDSYPRRGDDGPERHDSKSPARQGSETPAGPGDPARGRGLVAGATGPRCALCGRLGAFVRLQPLSR